MRHSKLVKRRSIRLTCAVILAFTMTAAAQRLQLPPGGSNWVEPLGSDIASGLIVQDLSTGLTPLQLAQSIVSGSGVTISNVQFAGVPVSAGTFVTTDPTIVGFTSGIILSSGNVNSIVGPNISDFTSTDNLLGGDPDLQAIIPGYSVNDASVLEFDFTTTALAPGQTGAVSFNFAWSSEEYNEYVFTSFNDVFGFFLNGQNIARLQDLVTPVSIDTVNGGNPYSVGGGVNPSQYRNNDLDDGGGTINTEMDGMTIVLTAFGNVTGPGPHHIKLAIADAGDWVYDSNVFIQGASLATAQGPTCIASTPTAPLNLTAQAPASWQIRAAANHGGIGASATIQSVAVTFDAGFAGNPVAVASPVAQSPGLPTTGQPAATTITWTPPLSAVGAWVFHYQLIDDLGHMGTCNVTVNVVPPVIGGPTCIAPTPTHDVEALIFSPVAWNVVAQANNGLPGGQVTILAVAVEFEANFVGGANPAPNPLAHSPMLPVTGQPAGTSAFWVPTLADVGQWTFDYQLIDNLGQAADCSITVNVRDAALLVGVAPTFVPLTPSPLDVLYVDAALILPFGFDDQPELLIPDLPQIVGLDIFVQVVQYNPSSYPSDPFKTSQTLRFRIGIANFLFATGAGIDLTATDIAQIGEALPYDATLLVP